MITTLNIVIALGLSFLTISFLPHVELLGVTPLLPLFFVLQLAYFRKGFEPLLVAAICGIFLDLFSTYPFGSYLILFLFTASVARYFFGGGLRILSFWHYLALTLIVMVLYLGVQTAFILSAGTDFHLRNVPPYIYGLLINLGFAAILYPLGVWYFDMVPHIENYLKRR